MQNSNKRKRSREFDDSQGEAPLHREPAPPSKLPEFSSDTELGSTTGVMRVRREENDETSRGDEDQPV